MKKCSSCQNENVEDARYCTKCGKPLFQSTDSSFPASVASRRPISSEETQKNQLTANKGLIGCFGIILLIFLISLVSGLFNSRDRSGTPLGTSSSPSDAGYVKGLGKDVIRQELDQWKSIGLVTSYEFSEQSVVVYLNHSDWISLPSNSKADFKAGIRSKWPDGSVVFRDSGTGERL